MYALWLLMAAFHTVYSEYIDEGAIGQTLSDYMAKYAHFRMLTAEAPRSHLPSSIFPSQPCQWSVMVWSLGEYGIGLSSMYMKLNNSNCSNVSRYFWNGTFPCVLIRGGNGTSCRGPPPPGTETHKWTLEDYGQNPPLPWKGDLPEPTKAATGDAVPFDRQLNCKSLSGLALARVAQRTGVYRGEAEVVCRRTKREFYVLVTGPSVIGNLRVRVKGAAKTDVLIADTRWDAAVDSSGSLVFSVEGRAAVRYSRRVLSGGRLIFEGHKRTVYSRVEGGEPRLCALSRMTSVCAVMNSISGSELETLGNVTGFDVHTWTVEENPKRAVLIDGTVLGTHGVLDGVFRAQALDEKEAGWTELPFPLENKCAAAMHAYADCGRELLVQGSPRVGAYSGRVTHHPFP